MVIKRTCSFCAGEIEPGTGTMFIKRDGSVFQFCTSSCRKQQLNLGRVGHRIKWTRSHELKVAAEQASSKAAAAAGKGGPKAKAPASPKPAAPASPPKEPEAKPAAEPKRPKAAAKSAAPKPSA